jgi:UDP-GlcNAc:undecaprenyl-phosphate/decaprenyl-phosphate GlcNAc-1-phosphate transferase
MMTENRFYAFVFFFTILLFSLMLNFIFMKFIKNLGMRNIEEGQIRWASTSKPAIGGISFFIMFLMSISAYSFIEYHENLIENKKFVGILLSCTCGFLIGLADDAYNTKPLLKFSVQLLCGFILIFSGIQIELFQNQIINHVLTIFWVVGIMNSLNMLDNMDGITSSISIVVLCNCGLILINSRNPDHLFLYIIIGMIACLLGFLYFNWNPSRMYMGDTGSMLLGVLLAALGIICFWNTPFDEIIKMQTKQVLIAILAFIIPIVDTATVSINRMMSGKSPFVGGKDHTTHHLSYMGLTDKQVALLLIAISLLSSMFVKYIVFVVNWSWLHISLLSAYILLVFVLLYSTTKLFKPKPKK